MDFKAYEDKMTATMKERTGKTMDEWVELVRATMPEMRTGKVKWLKETFGLGQNSAMLILARVEGKDEMRTPDLTDDLYRGANEPLRPVYDKLATGLQELGPDVKVSPCKTYTPFYRNKQFVFVRPHKGQLHIGLALPAGTEHPRLEPVGKMGGTERITLKITAATEEDLDSEAWSLIRQAYAQN